MKSQRRGRRRLGGKKRRRHALDNEGKQEKDGKGIRKEGERKNEEIPFRQRKTRGK